MLDNQESQQPLESDADSSFAVEKQAHGNCTTSPIRVLPDEQNASTTEAQIQEYRSSLYLEQSSPNFFDSRITCTQCEHLKLGKRDTRGRPLEASNLCGNHKQAELTTHELAPEFAYMRQRCPGFSPLQTSRGSS